MFRTTVFGIAIFCFVLCIAGFPQDSFAGFNVLLVAETERDLTGLSDDIRVTHRFGGRLALGELAPGPHRTFSAVEVYTSPVDTSIFGELSSIDRDVLRVWNRRFTADDDNELGDELIAPGNDALTGPVEAFRFKQPGSAGFYDTSEFLLGEIKVGLVLPESNGAIDPSTENWSTIERGNVLAEVVEGLDWWTSVSPYSVSFTYDIHYSIPVSYEPIANNSVIGAVCGGYGDQFLWINEAMSYLGYPSDCFMGVYEYANYLKSEADWGIVIFVVDSSNDSDGRFADDYYAYAYLGGPFTVMTYDNGTKGIDNMGVVCAHEVGHLFYALDQNGSAFVPCTSRSGYLDIQNTNSEYTAPGGCTSDDECIMRGRNSAYNNHSISQCASDMLGWRDTDQDSIPDILDVEPETELDEYLPDPTENPTPTYTGRVSLSVFPNQNPWGFGNDINMCHIASVEFKVDDGDWTEASPSDGVFDSSQEEFWFTCEPVEGGVHAISARGISSSGSDDSTPAVDTLLMIISNYPPDRPVALAPADSVWLAVPDPEFVWRFIDPDSGDIQSAFDIKLSADTSFSVIAYETDVVVSSDTTYIPDAQTGLPPGEWFWRIRTRDLLGYWSDFSSPRRIRVDCITPGSQVDVPADSSVVDTFGGISGSAFDTGSGLFAVEVKLVGDSDSTCFNGATWQQSEYWLSAGSDSIFDVPLSVILSNGESYTVESRASDIAGNIQNPAHAISFEYDIEDPSSSIHAPGGTYASEVPQVAGTASDAEDNLVSVSVAIRNAAGYWNGLEFAVPDTWHDAVGTEVWSFDASAIPFVVGVQYVAYCVARDKAGNTQSIADSVVFELDNVPPNVSISQPLDGAELRTLGTVTGTSVDSLSGVESVEVSLRRESDGMYWNGVLWDSLASWRGATGTSIWEADLNTILSDNTVYTLTARSTDAAGNQSSTSVGFLGDLSPPDVVIDEPPVSYVSSLETIAGTAVDSGTIALVEVAITDEDSLFWDGAGFGEQASWHATVGTDSWEFNSELVAFQNNSVYTIRVRAVDLAGNQSDEEFIEIHYDTTPPVAPLGIIIAPGWKGKTPFEIDWVVPYDFSGIDDGIFVKEGGPPENAVDGLWLDGKPAYMEASGEGDVPLYFWLVDHASNNGFESPATITVSVDTTGPNFGQVYHIPEELTASDDDTLVIVVGVSDLMSGLDDSSVEFCYRAGDTLFSVPQEMAGIGDGLFEGLIPPPSGGWRAVDGDIAFYLMAQDSVENISRSETTSVQIHPANSRPVVTSIEPSEGAFSGAILLYATSYDSDGVINRELYSYSTSDPSSDPDWVAIGVDMTPGTPYTWHTSFSAPDVWISASAYDGVDWSQSPAVAGPITIDNDPPSTTDNTPSTWQNKPFGVHLTVDDGDGIGVGDNGGTYHSMDSFYWVEGDTVEITREGAHDLWYYSKDDLGNVEEVRMSANSARLDTTSPVVESAWLSEDITDTPSDTLLIYASSSDLVSGISGMEAAWGFEHASDYVEMANVSGDTWSVKVPTPAGGWKSQTGRTFAFRVRAFDMAGNADTSAIMYDHVEEANNPPDNFLLCWPEDGTTDVGSTPVFVWTASCDPDTGDTLTYRLLVWGEMRSDTLSVESISDTVSGVYEGLQNGDYLWTVIAIDNHGAVTPANGGGGAWSFTVGETDVALTMLEAVSSGVCVELSWALFSDGEEYTLDVFRYDGFADQFNWGDGRWRRIDAPVSDGAMGRSSITDCDVSPGQVVSYCVVVSDEGGVHVFGPVRADVDIQKVSELHVGPCYPNPFNPRTTITIEVPEPGATTDVSIYTSDGRLAVTLLTARLTPGAHAVEWNGTDAMGRELPSGVYYYRVSSEIGSRSGRMVLLK